MFASKRSFNDSRFEFENKFNILAELIMEGRMNFSLKSRMTIESLKKIRKLPNGRIDLNTINELARVTANMAGNLEQMTEVNNKPGNEEE